MVREEYKLLDRVSSPRDLKKLSLEELRLYCDELRRYIIEACSVNPGHLASSLGTVELSAALHYVFETPDDKLVWDVGHQTYAHKIITGRRGAFATKRRLGGISGFPRMSESEYDAFGGGHASVSISAAFGMAKAAELRGERRKVVAVIGDGSMTGGLAFEGLNNAGASKTTDLLVILNDNHMAIDQATGALKNYLLRISTSEHYNRFKQRLWRLMSHTPWLLRLCQKAGNAVKQGLLNNSNLFESLNFRYFGPVDGHDLKALVCTLRALRDIPGPKLLHVMTVKGKGYLPAEHDQSVWHAPGCFNPDTGERISAPGSVARYQDVFGETLLELARRDRRVVGVTPAMPTGCSMNILMREMPDRCFDVGIAEGHAVTFSAGLAAAGMVPFCNIYSTFMQRAYDNVIHDVAIQDLPVVMCLDRGGLVGEDGVTHHGVFDMAAFGAVPGLVIAAPMNELELRNLMYTALQYGHPFMIRYPRGCGEGLPWRGVPFEEYMRRNIFGPAGMDSTLYFEAGRYIPSMSHGYTFDESAGGYVECDYGETAFYASKADGCLYSSLHDFALWEKALRGNSIIGEESKREAWTPHVMIPEDAAYGYNVDTGYGYGWFIQRTPGRSDCIYHLGDNGGYLNYAGRILDKGILLVFLANCDCIDRIATADAVYEILREAGII